MKGLIEIFETETKYFEKFFVQIEEYGSLGYTIEEIADIIEPSCSAEQIEQVIRHLKEPNSLLSKMYRNGQKQQKVERDQMIASMDKDNNEAVLKAIEIHREELMAKKIEEYYGL